MKFMSEFIFIFPFITIMYGERGGVDASGIGIIVAVGFVCSILFEVPTGVFSDMVARKYVILIGLLVNALGLSLWLLFPSFLGYLIAAVVFALGYAFESGSWQAYLYDVLPENDKKSFGKFWSRISAMVMVSYTIAYILTSLIGVRYELLITLSIISVIVALSIGLSLPKDTIDRSSEELKPKIFRSAIVHILGSKQLVIILLSVVITAGVADIAIEYGGLYFDQVGAETRYIPLLIALGNIVGAITFWTLHSWEHVLEKYKILFMAVALAAFCASFFGGLAVAVAGMLIFTRFIRLLEMQLESAIQHVARDENRATIASIASFGAKIFAACMALSIGFFSVDNSIVNSLRVSFIIAGLGFIVFHSLLRYRNYRTQT